MMSDRIPDQKELEELSGKPLYEIWTALCARIDEKYEMDRLWNKGGRNWEYEYKYRRGGKTLCALYVREKCIGLMIIFGKAEREKFEAQRQAYSQEIQRIYDEADTYRDGKWVMFTPEDTSMFDDYMKLLELKRRPNGKGGNE